MEVIDFVSLLETRAEQDPNKVIYRFVEPEKAEQTITYKQLFARVCTIAATLSEKKLRGQRAILVYPSGFDFIAALLACFAAEVIAVPAYPPVSKRTTLRLKNIITDCSASLILTTDSTLVKLQRSKLYVQEKVASGLNYLCTDSLTEVAAPAELIKPGHEQIAFIQYTSGSTSGIKGVMVSHQNLYYNSELIKDSMRLTEEDILVNWLPQFHDMGLIGGLLQPLFSNLEDILLSPFEFIKNPTLWLNLITQHQATVSGGPNFAYELCNHSIADSCLSDLDLSSWKTAFNGAEPISARTIETFSNRFKVCGFQKTSFYCCYGMAETTLFVSGNYIDSPAATLNIKKNGLASGVAVTSSNNELSKPVISSGIPNSLQKILIVNPETLIKQPENAIGEIWVQGSSNATGYWGEDKIELNKSTFCAYTADNQGPYLRTGDLGFLCQGRLFVTGRYKDLIIIRGENYFPDTIEEVVVVAHPGIRKGCVVAVGVFDGHTEKLIVLAEITSGQKNFVEEIIDKINEHVSQECDVHLNEIYLVKANSILKTSSGKLQRQASKQALMQGELVVVHSWSENHEKQDVLSSKTSSSNFTERSIEDLLLWLREYACQRINSFIMDERRCISPHIILHFAQKGLFGLLIPKKWGGLELSYDHTMRILEQISAINLSLGVFVGLANANIYPILHYGSSYIREKYIKLLAAGHDLAAFALTEPDAGSNLHQIKTTAIALDNGRWNLNGTKCWSGSAAWSGIINVFAKGYDQNNKPLGLMAFALPTDLPGIRQGDESITMGLKAMSQNYIHFENVLIDPEYVLGKPGDGLRIAEETLMNSRLGIAALSLGAMKRATQIATQFSNRRYISTGLLIENSLWINRLNEVHYIIKSTESLLKKCTAQLDKGKEIPIELVLANKVMSTEFLWKLIDHCMQILGGRSYIEVNGLAQILRDARIMRIFEGTSEVIFDYMGSLWLKNPQKLASLVEFLHSSSQVKEELLPFIKKIEDLNEQSPIRSSSQLLTHHIGVALGYAIFYAAVASEEEPACTQWARQLWQQHRALTEICLSSEDLPILVNQNAHPYTESIGWLQSSSSGQIEQTQDVILSSEQSQKLLKDVVEIAPHSAINTSTTGESQKKLLMWLGQWLHKKKLIPQPEVSSQEPIKNLGLDSLLAVTLASDLERHIQQPLPVDLIYECQTVQQLIEFTLQKQNYHLDEKHDDGQKHPELLNINKKWLSPFLDHGYQEEILHFTSINIDHNTITGKLDVTRYFMPSDGKFHLNIFNNKVALLQIFTAYIRQIIAQELINDIEIGNLYQRYYQPILSSSGILYNLEITNSEAHNEKLTYHVNFSTERGCFQGQAVFFVYLKKHHAAVLTNLVPDKTIELSKIEQTVPSWMNNPYESTDYELCNILVTDNCIRAEIDTKFILKNAMQQQLINFLLANIYTSQLGVIFACWDNQLTEKNGEFYLIQLNEKITSNTTLKKQDGPQKAMLQLKSKVVNFSRIIYTMSFMIDNHMSGEVVFAIPMVNKG